MKNRLIYLVILLSLVTGLPKVIAGEEENAIEAEGGKWALFYETDNLDGLMTLYTKDAVVALHGQPALFGKEAIREYFAASLGKAESTFELDYEVRQTHGDIAYIISKYWLIAKNNLTGAMYRDAGRSMLIYKKENGEWKIAADIDQASPDVAWPSPNGLK
jgi:uncharacterized protein (TIGR02246 family)